MTTIDIILTSLFGFLIAFGPLLIGTINLDAYSDDNVRIKFSTFLSLYAIKPESWCMYEDYVEYYKPCERNEYKPRYTREYDIERIYFGFIDTMRYRHWNKKREAQIAEQEMIQKTLDLAESWQNDIETYVRNANKEIQQMKEGIVQ